MNIFFDSSALVKRYIEEEGSGRVEKISRKAGDVMVSMICLPEIISAMNRERREGSINPGQYEIIKQRLLSEFEDFLSCPLTPDVIALSIGLLEKFSLRAMDALHIASALEIRADVFVSADKDQLRAAKKLRLKVYAV